MNIIAHGRTFVESFHRLLLHSNSERRVCPYCHAAGASEHGLRTRHPYTLRGRIEVSVQRYRCPSCGATYSDEQPDPSATLRADLPPGRWYARSVQRCAIDQWAHIPHAGHIPAAPFGGWRSGCAQ